MDEQELDTCFRTVVRIARDAGKMVVEAFSQEKRVELKSSVADLVTETDKKVEEMIISSIQQKYPTHSFIGEESTVTGVKCNLTDNPTWIIDPIDGTTNFVHGYPQVAISIALLVNKKTEIGLVYNPVRNEMYTARPGRGAYCNDRKLKVTNTEDLNQALVCTEIGSSRDPKILDSKFRTMRNIVQKAHGLRYQGSAAINMATVACGHLDAYFEAGVHCWDFAAGILFVIEAGGVVMDTSGGPLDLMSRRVLCAGTNKLAQQIAQLIEPIEYERD